MDGGATAFYFYMAATAAGVAVDVTAQRNANARRQIILEQELRSNELAALDEENQRLIALRHANDDMLVNSGGVDAWASPSLIAARAFNFQIGMEDITNTRFNLESSRAGISARIGILKSNSRAALASGIFQLAGIAANTAYGAAQLKKPPVTTVTPPSLSKAGVVAPSIFIPHLGP